MNRSKIVAIITGAISIILALVYLLIVQLLDLRGEMKPAPLSQYQQVVIAQSYPTVQQFSLIYTETACVLLSDLASLRETKAVKYSVFVQMHNCNW